MAFSSPEKTRVHHARYRQKPAKGERAQEHTEVA